jgi:hypothetical protein
LAVWHRWLVRYVLDDFEISLDGLHPNDEAREQSRTDIERLLRGRGDREIRSVLLEVYAALRGVLEV